MADALARARSWDQAIVHYDAVLELEPARREAWMKKATALFIAGRYADAAATLERGSAQLPDDRLLATATARFLASCPDRKLRDGKRALALAEQLFAGEESLENAELVAMAHAEIGAWSEAVAWQERALAAARRSGDERLAATLAPQPRALSRRQSLLRGLSRSSTQRKKRGDRSHPARKDVVRAGSGHAAQKRTPTEKRYSRGTT